ncbi:hypothetical protein FQA47_018194 [Oryzias melastigma]|uniref:Uncharacterized protein n=1 Tax=Oryzias melastigma TaxID=30732 RepID=A0A834BNC8_ORYME|nr:hypothetical protein FQA47_018194 [Oryzias melastigma]
MALYCSCKATENLSPFFCCALHNHTRFISVPGGLNLLCGPSSRHAELRDPTNFHAATSPRPSFVKLGRLPRGPCLLEIRHRCSHPDLVNLTGWLAPEQARVLPARP